MTYREQAEQILRSDLRVTGDGVMLLAIVNALLSIDEQLAALNAKFPVQRKDE